LVSRFFILRMGEKWNKWELDSAYTESKPRWIYLLGVFGLGLVGYSWYRVAVTDVRYSWVITALLSLTLVKVFNLTFNYERFREFVANTLNDRKRWRSINVGIIAFSVALVFTGIFLY
jgi:hypothetical protein